MKIKLLSILTLVLFTACSETPQKTKQTTTVIDSKIEAVKEAQKSVDALNKREEAIKVQMPIHTNVPNGASLYAKKCASCHGKDARKLALSTSRAIAGWSSTKTQNVLNGYKDGSYGGKMKGVMQGQSKPLSDSDIKLISDYISTL